MIEVRQLTKRYGSKVAVDALTFDVRPRVVTGFLGPNGSGKSTTLRLILGLGSRPRPGRLAGTANPGRSRASLAGEARLRGGSR
jgi:ABC-2 type transport system ATP-binding protein